MLPSSSANSILWPIFDSIYTYFTGYPTSSFAFIPGKTLLATKSEVFAVIFTYYALVFAGPYLLRNSPPMKLNRLFQLHNLGLTIVSAILLVLFLEQLIPILYSHGTLYAICSNQAWTQELLFLYYMNYLVKYVELLDTAFLVLKKKNLTFLHPYHHGATVVLCFSQILGHTSVSWVPVVLNLMVHVLMYYYYYLSAKGIRVWWKEWVTRLQIIQFVIDLGMLSLSPFLTPAFVYFASYTYFASSRWPWLPNAGNCAGEEYAAIIGCLILSSYLFLFISFYIATYSRARTRPKITNSRKSL